MPPPTAPARPRLIRPTGPDKLEDRTTPTLYVVTHGAQPGSTVAPQWAFDMAQAISDRQGFGYTADQINNSVMAFNAADSKAPAGGGDRIIVFNWADVSGLTSPGTADDDAVAGRLAEFVRVRMAATGERDVHFIGHSRGTYVNLSVINRLNNATDNAKIDRLQMTTLDPEFYDNKNPFAQNPNTESTPLVVPDNVDWAENYFQTADDTGPDLGGGVYTGKNLVNVDLTDTLTKWPGRDGTLPTHAEVHDWYHWTIDINDKDAASVRYRDAALNKQQDNFLADPATGRALLFSQTTDIDQDGVADIAAGGSKIGFHYGIGTSFGPQAFAGFTSVDLVFVIDTTGSMGDDIAKVQESARNIVAQLRASVPSFRVAVVAYRDKNDAFVTRVATAFTNDESAIQAAIDSLGASGGGDTPEGVFAGLALAIDSTAIGGWRGTTARKAIILMGDAAAHDPDKATGLTKEAILIRAFNADPVEIYPILIGDDPAAERSFSTLAQLSNGKLAKAATADDVVGSVLAAIGSATGGISSPSKVSREFALGGLRFATLANPDLTSRFSVEPFPGFEGEIRVAAADVTGDGIADMIVGTGPGVLAAVSVYDGATQAKLFSINPFEDFTGGVYVAAGDLDRDGKAEIVISPDESGGPRVRVFRGSDFAPMADFFGIDDAKFRGGVRVAVADVDGDGTGDLLVAAGFGGGPRVAIFGGTTIGFGLTPGRLVPDFFAFDPALRNGVFIAGGDVTGDGKGDVVTGAGPGGGPQVLVIDGASALAAGAVDLKANPGLVSADFFGGDDRNRGGIRVAVKNLDGDAFADVLTGSGKTGGSEVRGYAGKNLRVKDTASAFDFESVPDSTAGIFVG